MRRRKPPLPPPKLRPSFSNSRRRPKKEKQKTKHSGNVWRRTRKNTIPPPPMKVRPGRSTSPKRDSGRDDMVSVALLAQALPTASSGVDWLYQFSNNLTNLTTQNGGALTQLGLTELACISFFMLVSMVINWSTTSMTL